MGAASRAGGGRPCDRDIDVAVLAATRELLVEVGYPGLTYALVASQAGSSRPALYRRWPSKAHLVFDALFPSRIDDAPVDDPTFRAYLHAIITRVAASYRRPVARAAVPFLLGEIHDPERRRSIVDRLQVEAHRDFATRVSQAIVAGELVEATDPTLLLETVHAAALHHALGEETDDPEFAGELVALVLDGAPTRPGRGLGQPTCRTRDRSLVTDDGTRIVYRTGGCGGPALVFVHGWCSNRTHWDAQLGHFATSRRVGAVDRRGHGRSDVTTDGYTPARHARDLAEVVRRERLDEVVLVAHAGGGPTALAYADRHPDTVIALVLVDTFISGRTPLGRPHSAGRSPLGQLVDQLTGPDGAERFAATYRRFFSSAAGPEAEAAVRDAMAVPLRVARADLASLAADSEGPARRLRCPVLWLTVAPADIARLITVFRVVHFGVVVGSGHFPHLEVPDQVNAMIERFLTVVGPQA